MKRLFSALLAIFMIASVFSITVAADDTPLTAKRAVLVNDTTIVIEFSEAVKFAARAPFNAIRFSRTDSFGPNRATIDGSEQYLQFYGSFKVYEKDPTKMVYIIHEDDKSHEVWKGFNSAVALVEKTDPRLSVIPANLVAHFCIEGLSTGENLAGFVDNITSADGTKLLTANKASSGGIFDGVYLPIVKDYSYDIDVPNREVKPYVPTEPTTPTTPTTPTPDVSGEPLVVEKAVMINDDQIVIKFSEPVTIKSSFTALRLSTSGTGYTKITLNGKEGITHFYGSLKVNENDPSLAVWTFSTSNSDWGKANTVSSLKALVEGTDANFKKDGKALVAAFCIEELTSSGKSTVNGFVESVVAKSNPSKMLTATQKNAEGKYGYEAVYKPIEVDYSFKLPTAPVEDQGTELKVKRAVRINETQIVIEFTEPVHFVGKPWHGVRFSVKDKFGPNQIEVDGIKEYLQFWGSAEVNKNDPRLIVWTFTPGAGTDKWKDKFMDLAAIVDKTDARIKDVDMVPYFCFEGTANSEIASPVAGYLDNIQNAAGAPAVANKSNAGGIYDGIYVPIETDLNYKLPTAPVDGGSTTPSTPPATGALTVKRAVMINDDQIVIEFSEAVTIKNSFTALRLSDSGTGYTKTTVNGKEGITHFYGSLKVNENDPSLAVWTFSTSTSDWGKSNTVSSLKALVEGTDANFKKDGKALVAAFCIEELTSSGKSTVNGFVESVVAKKDSSKMLTATRKNTGNQTGYEAVYVPIVVDYDYKLPTEPVDGGADISGNVNIGKVPDGSIYVKSATLVSNDKIELVFSEPVKFNGSVWACIRYVDPDTCALIWVDENPMQFGGDLQLNGTAKGVFTTGSNLDDLFKKKGHENTNWAVTLCFEELPAGSIPAPKKGYIDTITSADGTKLLGATLPNDNPAYDGYYIGDFADKRGDIPDVVAPSDIPVNPDAVNVVEMRILNSKQILLTLDQEVTIKSNPFSAIRFVDANNNLKRDESRPARGLDAYLHWTGSLVARGNTLLWTMGNHTDATLAELLELKNYENLGYRVTLCIEGLSYGKNVPGLIDNIQSADGKMLNSNKHSSSGVYDGLYLDNFLDREMATYVNEIPTARHEGIYIKHIAIVDDTHAKIIFSEPVTAVGEGTLATQYSPVLSAFRFVNTANEVRYDGNKKLEFKGMMEFNDTAEVDFELWSNVTLTIPEILALTGYEDSGYRVAFAIEETADAELIPEPQKGYIDNVRSLDGSKLLVAHIFDISGSGETLNLLDFEDYEDIKAKEEDKTEEKPDDGNTEEKPDDGKTEEKPDDGKTEEKPADDKDDEKPADGDATPEPKADNSWMLWLIVLGVVIIGAVIVIVVFTKKK